MFNVLTTTIRHYKGNIMQHKRRFGCLDIHVEEVSINIQGSMRQAWGKSLIIYNINFVKTSTECCFSTWHCLYRCRLYHHCSNQQCNSVLNMWCFCAIWYNLYDLKNVKNTHGGMLLLVKLQAFCRLLNIICFTNWAVTTNTFLCKSLFQGMWLVFYMFFSEAATKDDL